MSPTIIRPRNYQVMIFTNDHPPAHVHVRRAGNEARISLDPIEVMDNYGFRNREIKQILRIIEDNQTLLLTEWDNIHPSR